MNPSRVASLAALVGGVSWSVAALLAWGDTTVEAGPAGLLVWFGAAVLVVALGSAGYALVATAPVWLRALVSVATPVLVAMVWTLVADALGAEYLSALVGALFALASGALGLRRGRPAAPVEPAPVRGRRAARGTRGARAAR